MTAVVEQVGPRGASLARTVALAVVVVAVELLWASYGADVERQLATHVPGFGHPARPVQWAFVSVPFLLLAVGVGPAARTAQRGLAAVGLCVVGALVGIGSYEVVDALFTHGATSTTTLRAVGYATVVLVAVTATLAWCVSRRHGTSWWLPTLVVAAVAAVLLYRLHVRYLHEVLPVVLACLVAWAIEVRATRP